MAEDTEVLQVPLEPRRVISALHTYLIFVLQNLLQVRFQSVFLLLEDLPNFKIFKRFKRLLGVSGPRKVGKAIPTFKDLYVPTSISG